MFNLFKRKNRIEDDPILKEINRQAEDLLKSMGYTDEDLKKIESESKLKVVK